MNEATLYEARGFAQTGSSTLPERTYLAGFRWTWDCPGGDTWIEFTGYAATADFNCSGVVDLTGTVVSNINGRTKYDYWNQNGNDVGTNRNTGVVTPDDCIPSSTWGCDLSMRGVNDWPLITFTGLTKWHSYGGYGSEAKPDPLIQLPIGSCVTWLAGGRLCTR